MNIKTKMQKIISAAILCFAFFVFVPVVIAEVAGMKTVENNIQISGKQINWAIAASKVVAAPITLGAAPFIPDFFLPDSLKSLKDVNIKVNLENAPRENSKISDNSYTALSLLAGGGNQLGLINPESKKPYEKENIYTIGTNDGVSYYYKPNPDGRSGTPKEIDDWQNANTVLIAHANDGKAYFPDGIDSEGKKINYILKGGEEEDDFNNSIDIVAGRTSDTTNTKLDAVDKLQQNKETLSQDQKTLEQLLQEFDEADRNDTLDETTRNEKLEEIRQKRESIARTEADIRTGTEASAATTVELKCGSGITAVGQFFTNIDCIVSMLAIVGNIVLKVSAFVLYIVGNLFDMSIEIAINSAQFIDSLQIVEPTWAAIRDFLNMTFIFILIYISWQILLGNSNYNAKNSVARLVLVAILINFSLFAAKAMVDGSNIISLNKYEGIKAKGAKEDGRGSVSTRIMSTLGLPGVYNFNDAFNNEAIPGCGSIPNTILMVSVFGTIMILITAMTFLVAAVLFFLRMLNILALFITSPIWVWGYVIQHPKIKEQSDKWWSNMVHVMKFPIMYMFILYVSLAMFAQLNSNTTTANGTRVSIIQIICNTANEQGKKVDIAQQLPIILNFILVIAALIGAIKYSAGEATKGNILGTGKFGASVANKFEGFSRKMTTGAAQGLYNKAKTPAGLATIATLATGGAYGALAGAGVAAGALVAKPAGRLAKDGLRLAGHNTTDWLSNKAGEQTTSGGVLKKTAFAMLSNKLKDAKVLGETRKDATARRTASATRRETLLAKVQSEQTKIEEQEAWEKKNPGGDYNGYVERKIELIEKLNLGSLRDASSQKDAAGNAIKNSDFIRQAWDETKDANGNVISRKLNQDKLYRNLDKVIESHEKDGSYLTHMGRFETFYREKAKASTKARRAHIQSIGREAKSVEKINKEISILHGNLQKLPSADSADPTKKMDYHQILRSYLTEKEKIISDLARKMSGNVSPVDAARFKSTADAELEELKLNTEEKIEKERYTIEDKIEKKKNRLGI